MLGSIHRNSLPENKSSPSGVLKPILRQDDSNSKRSATANKPTQKIRVTYKNYDQIFTEPVQLESRVAGQSVNTEPTKKDLSEDFFRLLEGIRPKSGHDLQITLVFSEEKRDSETEKEIRGLYRQNYEDDIAASKRTVREYKKKSKFYYGVTGVLTVISGSLLFIGMPKNLDLAQGLMENSKRIVEDVLFVASDLYLFLYGFAGWHLSKEKPEQMYEQMQQKERYLNAKITIITADEIRRNRAAPPSAALPAQDPPG